MAVPVAVAVAPWLVEQRLFGEGVTVIQASLFTGATTSITAFSGARAHHPRTRPVRRARASAGAVCRRRAAAADVLHLLAASVLVKGGACWTAARLSGRDDATAMAIGAPMNARRPMELIIINIGLQRGLIGPALFSILVLMAIVTTVLALPLFERVYGRRARVSRHRARSAPGMIRRPVHAPRPNPI